MRKMGRPRIENDVKRDHTLHIRVSSNEEGDLNELCDYFKCDRSSLIRSLISKVHSDIYGGEMNANNS